MRYVKILLLIVLSVASLAPAAAQEDGNSPLFELLALVPDNDMSRVQGEWQTFSEELTVSYVNLDAVESAREPVVNPAGYEAFTALSEDMQDLWWSNISRIAVGTGELLSVSTLTYGEFVRDAIGFETFGIDQYVEVGRPPIQLTVMAGNFDPDAIATAHTNRDYAANDVNGVTVWRRADGEPDSTYQTSFPGETRDPETLKRVGAEIHRATPFGGRMGRKEPMAVMPTDGDTVYTAVTINWDLMTGVVDAYNGEGRSLADAPDYRTLAEAITGGSAGAFLRPARDVGVLVQAQFIALSYDEPHDVMWTYEAAIRAIDELSLSDTEALIAQFFCGYGELPPSTLAVIADLQDGDDAIAMVALYYPDAETAELAAAELGVRVPTLNGYLEWREPEPYTEWVVEGARPGEPYVYTSQTTGHSAAVMMVRYDIPPPTPGEEDFIITPGRLMLFWMRAVYSATFHPIQQIDLSFLDERDLCE
jgi:hypothetical protein